MIATRCALLALLLAGCGSAGVPSVDDESWHTVPLENAQCFSISARDAERKLTVFGAGGASDTVGVYVLSTSPAAGGFPAHLTRIAVVSTTHLSYIQALQALDAVVGAAHMDRLNDGELIAQLSGVLDIGTAEGLDRERLIALRPEVLLDYPFGQGGSTNNLPDVPRISITEYLEEHPLGRAEWIRFFGVLLGREQLADSLYRAVADRYRASIHPAGTNRPRVFFGSSWQSHWYVPPGTSYMGRLIADAGGDYCFKDLGSKENSSIDLEQVLDQASRSAHFGAVLARSGPVDALALAGGDRRLSSLPAIAQGGFAVNSASSDFFGRALLEPDVVLRDLRCIFQPNSCNAHEPVYFMPIIQ